MKRIIQAVCIVIFLISSKISLFCADISNSYGGVSSAFDIFTQKFEGETAFRSLLIPSGGRFEGLNGSFTALSNDISFFDANPAASALLKETEINVLHNSWIADSKLETIGYTQRKNHLGWGTSLRCFYIPFTEYGHLGQKKASGYYSETFLTANIAYNFLAGYDFKGLSIGGSIKTGIRSMPPFSGQGEAADLEYPEKQNQNASRQNGYAVLGDFGIMIRANVSKIFYSNEPNFYFGLSLKNFGTPIKGELPPSYISLGFAYRPVSFFLFEVDVNQGINVANIKRSGLPYGNMGMMFSITKYFNLLTGFGIKGGNPRFTLGGEVNLSNIQISANYTLDLSSQVTNISRISIGVKFLLGQDKRDQKQNTIEKLYIQGLKEYNSKNYQRAIEIWQEILSLDKRYDPAIEGIARAEQQLKLLEEIKKILLLD
ncbi:MULTISPECIES: UPF0164 family protein [unclassified Treponema]|uniref:UPF0164 family protein n=1 Tax=unclassified Treponema TaxID=2638727 RepID=UPI0020A44BEB|nr:MULTISPECIES: UPF0164 family protein [unclassified Treponema]UTC67662.1 UPF0164 family protein [Treponema sp. OMZ 789]UTC70390.1 UPF0164 family protein [Treponema sp. OMZ 790]UTC73104.1 UPF0164 family protein [Treponema sp. OMZ 791]